MIDDELMKKIGLLKDDFSAKKTTLSEVDDSGTVHFYPGNKI